MSSQNLANAIDSMNRTRIDATGNRLRLKDGERLHPKSWSGSTALGGFEREVAAWLVYVDPKHEAGKSVQQIKKGTLRVTEAWIDGRHAEDDKCVERDYDHWPMRQKAQVLKVTQVEPSHGFVAWRLCAQVIE